MQSVSSRIWTRVAVSISYDNNDYTTGTSIGTDGATESRESMLIAHLHNVDMVLTIPIQSW